MTIYNDKPEVQQPGKGNEPEIKPPQAPPKPTGPDQPAAPPEAPQQTPPNEVPSPGGKADIY